MTATVVPQRTPKKFGEKDQRCWCRTSDPPRDPVTLEELQNQ
ncbi:hypothetical protein DB30_03847 [Enhygromyxa salina]|uniref:Uncharacterized protein n=1 Tax=Enhygromyxa salina TaxID=215803 RepID=A0A0C2D845_9BACT|nr:hypothetical protein DB30_03847 [Enhygromyxa salina]